MLINILDFLNENIIWGTPMLILFIGTGVYFTFKLRFYKLSIFHILRETLFDKNKSKNKNKSNENSVKTLSPFQALTSTLAVTLGTGNIAALGTAILFGGAGAVFWMWVSALLGMATAYAENYLGMLYRRSDKNGGYKSGVFFYIERALGKSGGVMFAVFCILASFGMGNMTQINALSRSAEGSFGTPAWASGVFAAVIVGLVTLGGAVFFGEITEKVIPLISAVYILGCFAVIVINITEVPVVAARILNEALNIKAMGGGAIGAAISWGFRRGVFSNEAGLGSTVIMNSMSAEQSPRKQSLWATLAVFFDTIVICTLTAFVILLTGADGSGAEGVTLANTAFKSAFAGFADIFVTVSLCIFALATTCGWSVFGAASLAYLFGETKTKAVKVYLALFAVCCFIGAVTDLEIIWGAADIFNGLMAVPNLLAVIILRKKVKMQD